MCSQNSNKKWVEERKSYTRYSYTKQIRILANDRNEICVQAKEHMICIFRFKIKQKQNEIWKLCWTYQCNPYKLQHKKNLYIYKLYSLYLKVSQCLTLYHCFPIYYYYYYLFISSYLKTKMFTICFVLGQSIFIYQILFPFFR